MRILPDPGSRFGWKLLWTFTAVAIALLLGGRPISVVIGMACAYLLTWYLKSKTRGPRRTDDAHRFAISDFVPDNTLTSLSLNTPAEKPEDQSKKQGAA